jgi:NRAMP (natural resistance-associated macrophage protein)-like metal ion transporter
VAEPQTPAQAAALAEGSTGSVLPSKVGVPRGRFRLALLLSVVGPGIITAMADNDAGGIATYSQAGADFGYGMIWTLIPITAALVLVQEMCARMGLVTGKGLADLIRERFGVKATFYVMLALLVANLGTTTAEFSGVAQAMEIFGVPRWVSVPISAAAVWLLVIKGSARMVERIFMVASLCYVSYAISGFLAAPDWREVLTAVVHPHLELTGPSLTMVVTLIGTTVTPWMQFYLQSAVVEKKLGLDDFTLARADVIVGCIVTDVVSFFIILACGATIHKTGGHVEQAIDAAAALGPLAGKHAALLYSFGLLNASLFAASILPLSTSYYICEGFGWESGIDKKREEAPQFYFLYTAIIVVGALPVLVPDLPLLKITLASQTANGVLLPFILIFILLLCGDGRLMGRYRNGPVLSVVSWATAAVLIALAVAMVWLTLAG